MQAEKKLSGGDGFFSFLSDKSGNDSDGADLLEKAANAFMAENKFLEAGKAFERLAPVYRDRLELDSSAAGAAGSAIEAYVKAGDAAAAARCFELLRSPALKKGQSNRVDRYGRLLAGLYEKTLGDMKSASMCYDVIAEEYEANLNPHNARKNKTQAAATRAIYFAQLVTAGTDPHESAKDLKYVERTLIKLAQDSYNTNEVLLRLGIVYLITGDSNDYDKAAAPAGPAAASVGAQAAAAGSSAGALADEANAAFDAQTRLDFGFAKSREGALVRDLAAALKADNLQQFVKLLMQYPGTNEESKAWYETMLMLAGGYKWKGNAVKAEMERQKRQPFEDSQNGGQQQPWGDQPEPQRYSQPQHQPQYSSPPQHAPGTQVKNETDPDVPDANEWA
ncbi:Tetratricopeptide-like helical [Metarhizium album ARSEF 1941]|uniref:Gamma-soluble NSF attachment protein n=1 Tax=Metarhizium album (strain ARSEF 1941) TaxID=1081103 RepID=A0A0B2X8Y3_METAS|nr:Tetratricopeptide-like helical [Metarhizium album ARSEF 1941]KHO02030.1 Tetratricopeptide-like helical [Metarhizium album ARSEF 1941]